MTDSKEKVYLTRDEGSDKIFVWRKPGRGNWSPQQLKGCEMMNYTREDMSNVTYYFVSDFKKKYGISIRQKTKKCIHLPVKLLNDKKDKLIS